MPQPDFTRYTERVLVLSTGHIPADDNRRLRLVEHDDRMPPYYRLGETGYLIHIARDTAGIAEHMADATRMLMSDEFVRLMLEAHQQGFEWLLLDADGRIHPDLPKFDW